MSQIMNAQQGSQDWSDLERDLPLLQEASTDSSVPHRYQNVIRQAYRFATENIQQSQGMVRTATAGSGQQGETSNIGGSSGGSGSTQQQQGRTG